MKKVLLIALCFAIPMVGFAQKKKKKGAEPEVVAPVVETLSDEECLTNLSLFHESVKNDQFEDAYATWLPVYQSRPDLNKAIYTDGAEILGYRYQQTKDENLRKALRDSIMQLHDDRIKYFGADPTYPGAYVLGLKASDYLTYYPEDELAMPAYGWFKEAITNLSANAPTKVYRNLMNFCRLFMTRSIKVYKSNPEQYANQVLEDYQLVTTTLNQMGGNYTESAKAEKTYIDGLFAASGAADCDMMDKTFANKVAESANDIEMLSNIMKLYRKVKCIESEVYFAAVEHAHKLQPSAESAAGCAQMCLKKENLVGAVEYYKQALELVDNDEDKVDYLYGLAYVYSQLKNNKQCVAFVQQALELNPEHGRCYVLLGFSYAAEKLSDDDVLDATKYWVACDMLMKAKQLDESCAKVANEYVGIFSKYFPTKTDIFMHQKLGSGVIDQPYHVGGWINKTTRCRARKE